MRAILALTLLSTCAAVWAQVPDGMNPEQVAPTSPATTITVPVHVESYVPARTLDAREVAFIATVPHTPNPFGGTDDLQEAVRQMVTAKIVHVPEGGKFVVNTSGNYWRQFQGWTAPYRGSVTVPQPHPLPLFTPAARVVEMETTELDELPEISGLTQLPPVWIEQVDFDCRPAPTPCPPPVCRRPTGAVWYGSGGGRVETNIGYAWGYWRNEPPQPGDGTCPPGKPPEPPSPGQAGGGNGDPSGPGQGGPGGYEPQPPPPSGYDPGIPGNGGPGNNPPPPATPSQGGGSTPPGGGTGGAYPAP